jgi:S1-C subfamily serine protease
MNMQSIGLRSTLTLCGALLWLAAAAAQTPPGAARMRSAPNGTAGAVPVEVAAPIAESPDWARTLERIVPSVVTIKVDQTRSFDTERNATMQATGFIVDAQRGLILTNRHVVTPGPVMAEATFQNREEVQLYPVYRDPVHDFGIYHYDPAKLRFMKPETLPLVPAAAQVGREIRVLGNNAGEQLSILAGTLARLDREAPDYGTGRYNDFNTFYIQAASGTSGGSSGSPVIDVQGRVVALNAGGASGAASSFYLPLGRIQRALQLIQAGKPVTRGTLQTEFKYRPYDELRRLGLQNSTESLARSSFPDNTGMLVVEDVQPGSAADSQLMPGDVLVRINDHFVAGFEALEAILDDGVGKPVRLELERGGKPVNATVSVGDLDAITPSAYVEFGDAIVHTVSYQLARHYHTAIKGVYVAAAGYSLDAAGLQRGAVITAINKQDVNTLDDFARLVSGIADGERMSVRYYTMEDTRRSQLRSVIVDRRWFPARRCQRDDSAGLWNCSELPAAPAAAPPQGGSVQLQRYPDRTAARLAASLVAINFDMPFPVSGVNERNYHGIGLIVDAARGLLITDRNTVPVSIGDVRLTFGRTLEIPGEVVYVHPLHNLAVIKYDPKLIGTTPVRAAEFSFEPLAAGQPIDVVGLDENGELQLRATAVSEVHPLILPLSRTVQFRDANLEVAAVVNPPDDVVGVLADKVGKVRALWASFATDNGRELVQENRGIAADVLAETLQIVNSGQPLRSLEAEFVPQSLASARNLGLTDAWMLRIQQASPTSRQVLAVTRLTGGSDAAAKLQPGDLVLAVDGKITTRFRDVEQAVAGKPTVKVTVWNADGERQVAINTAALSGMDVDRLVFWAGATLQAPHRAISAQRSLAPQGVYVAYYNFGSPATRYGLQPGRRILEVDGEATPDLDAFIRLVKGKADRSSLRLRTVGWNGAPEVITLKLDRHYWPSYELRRTQTGWERRSLE